MNIAFKNEKYGDQEWPEFKPGKMSSTDAEDIEKVTGMTFVQWGQSLMNGSALCGRALVWILLRKQNRSLRFREVDFSIDELSIELDDEEKQRLREELMKNDDLSEEDRRAVLIALGETDLNRLDFEPEGEDEVPGNGSTAESGADSA